MAMISQKDRDYIKKSLDEIPGKVTAVVFTSGNGGAAGGSAGQDECEYCKETKELVEELAGISGNFTAEYYDIHADVQKAKEYEVERVPTIILLDTQGRDRGVRFYGFPGGYEFSTLIADITDVGKGESRLSAETKAALAAITTPVRIDVFVTPT